MTRNDVNATKMKKKSLYTNYGEDHEEEIDPNSNTNVS